jgi:hypothetical protein
MAENLHGKGGCQCEVCRRENRNLQEARVIVAAWRKAQERLPAVGLRVLTSEATFKDNAAILALLPPGVKVVYYHSLLTYTAAHQPMLGPELATAAEGGRWVGVTPQLTGFVGPACPFTGAAFVQSRMREFVDKHLSGFTAYVIPRLAFGAFNLEAAAEWSWHSRGRSTREFAASYAVRHRLGDPELFADWSEAIGPVAWDLYGSDWPAGDLRNAGKPVAEAVRDGDLPELGSAKWGLFRAPWGDFHTPDQLRDDVAQATRALELARRIGRPEVIQESLYVQGCAQALAALWELKGGITPAGIESYVAACDQAATAVRRWANLVDPAIAASASGRFWRAAEALEASAAAMRKLAP